MSEIDDRKKSNEKKDIINFDPFNPSDKGKDEEAKKEDGNMNILYITGAIIIFLIIVYIIIVIFTREPNNEILDEMINPESQTPPVSDVLNVEL